MMLVGVRFVLRQVPKHLNPPQITAWQPPINVKWLKVKARYFLPNHIEQFNNIAQKHILVVHENIPADSFEATVLLTESPEPHCPRPRRTKGAGEPGPARAQQTVMAHNGLPSLPKWTGAMWRRLLPAAYYFIIPTPAPAIMWADHRVLGTLLTKQNNERRNRQPRAREYAWIKKKPHEKGLWKMLFRIYFSPVFSILCVVVLWRYSVTYDYQCQ